MPGMRPGKSRFGSSAGRRGLRKKAEEEPVAPGPGKVPIPGAPPPPKQGPTASRPIRLKPRTTRRPVPVRGTEGDEELEEEAAPAPKQKNPMIMIGGICGGVFLLIMLIAVIVSSGSSGSSPRGRSHADDRAAVAPKPAPAPVSRPRERASNFVVNTGAIMFVCAGTPAHEDIEVVVDTCVSCGKKNRFAFQTDTGKYQCDICKTVLEKSAMVCSRCNRPARRPHFKKVVQRRGD